MEVNETYKKRDASTRKKTKIQFYVWTSYLVVPILAIVAYGLALAVISRFFTTDYINDVGNGANKAATFISPSVTGFDQIMASLKLN